MQKTEEKGKKKKNLSSWAVSISVLDICVLLSFTFVHWLLSMDYCTKKRHSECLSSTHLISRQKKKKKKDVLRSREVGGLVVRGYDGISVLFKKNYFVYLFPSSDWAMKTRISHYAPSVIWLWGFCLLIIKQTWVRRTHRNPAQGDFGSRDVSRKGEKWASWIKAYELLLKGFQLWFDSRLLRFCEHTSTLRKTVLLLERCLLYSTVTLTFGSFEAEGLLFGLWFRTV